jgi:hypothetical protein
MSGRRSHARYTVTPASEGLLRVLRDVMLQSSQDDEIIAISREPGVVGEQLQVEMFDEGASTHRAARIADSRPVVIDGALRHRLRLELV